MPHIFWEYVAHGHIIRVDRTDGTAEVRHNPQGWIKARCSSEEEALETAKRLSDTT
jgi:hypothetical protein